MREPLTPVRLAEIRSRLALVDGEPRWYAEGNWLVEVVDGCTCGIDTSDYPYMHEPGCGEIPLVEFGSTEAAHNALTFIAAARQDVRDLLNEIERLRGPQPPFWPNWHEVKDDGRDKK